MSAEITGVVIGSPADKCGVKKGDILVSVNGHKVNDVLDYMYYSSESTVVLLLKRQDKHIFLKLRKSEYDDLGLEFDTFLMDKKQSCCNKCVFCFIDQMPEGMRETLYFKDDDARLSFLHGNYVTLTNLRQEDIDRIIRMKLNVNISVHTTNPELRCEMMHNRFAGEKLDYLRQLSEAGISMNCQIVLCPGLNDGDELRRTLTDLGNLMPNISSVAIVPVGLTKFREGLYPLTMFDKEGAEKAIDIISGFQEKFLHEYGTRLVFASDELYLTAGIPIPDGDFYEEYPQYENGVGMIRSLYDEFFEALQAENGNFSERDVSIATGAAAYELISELADAAEKKFGLRCRVYKIINHFFGETITVTGLLTAGDIISQLKGKELGDELLLSKSMVIHGGDLFLDDMTSSDVEKQLGVRLGFTENNGHTLLAAMLGK
ncbi:MAG: DUF512 domain-containing protein [Oscillospiraceae bacterium]|nr:DUF512 domain-containing protein [Oscillospiraceae bacterium]